MRWLAQSALISVQGIFQALEVYEPKKISYSVRPKRLSTQFSKLSSGILRNHCCTRIHM